MTTLKASEEGLVKIKQARRERGSTIEDPIWLVEASQKLEPDRTWTEAGPYADGLSLPTWRRFLGGREPIKANAFRAFCRVLQLNWEEIVDRPPLAPPYQEGVGAGLFNSHQKHEFCRGSATPTPRAYPRPRGFDRQIRPRGPARGHGPYG
ncbi:MULTISPECIES: hypothetical protein [unclassified Microcoleus]|uniref:hypothetical protein n=1 Tax=unclassified Microcoleus TaxID=2642155 RepID=UPI002FD780F2